MALAVVLVAMIALTLTNTLHSHWLHRLNPLKLFKRNHNRQSNIKLSQNNATNSKSIEDISTHFGLQVCVTSLT